MRTDSERNESVERDFEVESVILIELSSVDVARSPEIIRSGEPEIEKEFSTESLPGDIWRNQN